MVDKLEEILTNVGDLGLRRRIITLLRYLKIKDSDLVLDCGCGEGFYSMLLSELYQCRVVAVDTDGELLVKARRWIGKRKKISFQVADVTELPFEDETFDKIILSEVLEHIPDDEKAIKEAYRVLKKGGIVGITVPNHNYPFFWDPLNWLREHLGLGHFNSKNTILGGVWSYDHKRLYSYRTIKRLTENVGFKVLKIEALTHYCFPFNYHILRLGKLLYTKSVVSLKVKESMEKFEWRKKDFNHRVNLIRVIFNIFKWIDSQNDKLHDGINKSSVSILLELSK